MKPLWKIIIGFTLISIILMSPYFVSATTLWYSDGTDLSNWTQANGDPAIDADNGGWHASIGFDHIVYQGKFAPETPQSQDWWISYGIPYYNLNRYSGIYRALGVDESNNWEITVSIDFNNYATGVYSHQGGFYLYLLNENRERMMMVYYQDGSGSTNQHYLNVQAYYYDASDTAHVIYNPGSASASNVVGDWIIRQQFNHIECYWPMANGGSVPGTGSWIDLTNEANGEDLLQRGTLTYILIMQRSRYRAPTTSYITSVQVDDNVEVEPTEWYQANGDDDIDGDHGGWHASIGYSHIPYLNYYAPSTPPDQGWWISYNTLGFQNNRYSGVYRPLNVIENAYWELKVGIDFNNYATGTYSYQGGFSIYLLNEQKEPMLKISYWDGSGSSSKHYLSIKASYFDTSGVEHIFFNPDPSTNAYNVVDEIVIQRCANHIQCFWPTAAFGTVPGTGIWQDLTSLAAGTDLLQRGTMTYLLVMQRSRYRAPTTAYITSFEEAGSEPEPHSKSLCTDYFANPYLSDAWTVNEYLNPNWPIGLDPYIGLLFQAGPRPPESDMNGYAVEQQDLTEREYFSIETQMFWQGSEDQYVDLSIYLTDDNDQIVGRVRRVYSPNGNRIELIAGYGIGQDTLVVEETFHGSPIDFANHLDIRIFRRHSNPNQITIEADYDDTNDYPETYIVEGFCDTMITKLSLKMLAKQISGTSTWLGYFPEIEVEPIFTLKYPHSTGGYPFKDPIENNDFEESTLSHWVEDPIGVGERSSVKHIWTDNSWFISAGEQVEAYALRQTLTEDSYFKLESIMNQRIAFSFHAHKAQTSSEMRAAITYWIDGKQTKIFGEWISLSDDGFTTISVETQSPIPDGINAIEVSIEGQAYQSNYFSAYIDAAQVTIKHNSIYDTYHTLGQGLFSAGVAIHQVHVSSGEAQLVLLPVLYAEETNVGGGQRIRLMKIEFDVLEGDGSASVDGWGGSPGAIQSNDKNIELPDADAVQQYNDGIELIATGVKLGTNLAVSGAALVIPGAGAVGFVIKSAINFGVDFFSDVWQMPVPANDRVATIGDPGVMEWIYPFNPYDVDEYPSVQSAQGSLRLKCDCTTATSDFFTLRITFYVSFACASYHPEYEQQSILLVVPV